MLPQQPKYGNSYLLDCIHCIPFREVIKFVTSIDNEDQSGMNSPDAISIGCCDGSRLSNQVVRIVHISDTHLQHTSLSPPRPISGNISIRRSLNKNSTTNQIVDEVGFDAFERHSLSLQRHCSVDKESDSVTSDTFHKGGTFLSGASPAKRKNPNEIPCGDVLVHSGDFDWSRESGGFLRSNNFEEIVQIMNDFFDRFPHKVKLFVAGNHESSFDGKKLQTVQERLTSAVYLFNSSYTYEGINFYGAPYTPFRFFTNARGFIRSSSKLAVHWRDIPESVNVLVTHSPPFGILDLGVNYMTRKLPKVSGALRRFASDSTCTTCHLSHPGRGHFGCPVLRDEVLHRIKPELHLFGHVHEGSGVTSFRGITFCNSAFVCRKKTHVFDFFCS